jgi:hypothetical protein
VTRWSSKVSDLPAFSSQWKKKRGALYRENLRALSDWLSLGYMLILQPILCPGWITGPRQLQDWRKLHSSHRDWYQGSLGKIAAPSGSSCLFLKST